MQRSQSGEKGRGMVNVKMSLGRGMSRIGCVLMQGLTLRGVFVRTLAPLVFGLVAIAWNGVVAADTSNSTAPSDRAVSASAVADHIDTLERFSTLCKPEEVIVFSCALPNKKVVSLCASIDASNKTGYMQYRFGRDTSSIELEYPRKKVPAKEFFKYYSLEFTKGGSTAITFRIGTYRYSLYSTSSAFGYNGAGVIVNRGQDAIRVSFLKCISAPIKSTDVHIGYFERLGLPDAGDDISYDGPEPGPEPGSEFYHPKPGEPEDWRLRTKH